MLIPDWLFFHHSNMNFWRIWFIPLNCLQCGHAGCISPNHLKCGHAGCKHSTVQFLNVGLYDIQSVQYQNEKHSADKGTPYQKKGPVWYRNAPVKKCSGTVMLQCQTEMPDAGIPILAALASMLMPSYVQHAKHFLNISMLRKCKFK